MEKQKLLNADYLDILYDNRNKNYGGYNLRTKYPDRARRATLTVLMAAGLLSSIPVIASVLAGKQPHGRDIFEVTNPNVLTKVDLPKHPDQPPVKPVTQPATAAAIAKTVAVPELKIVPTDHVTDDAPPTIDSLGDRLAGKNNNDGNPNGLVADNGQADGPGKVMPSDPPIAIEPPPAGPVRKVTQMPEFNGDVADYLSNHLRYPEIARQNNDQGRAIIEFVVNEDGAVTNTTIARSSGTHSLDAEALRVVGAMPKWKPGKDQGKAVKVYFNLPITFRID